MLTKLNETEMLLVDGGKSFFGKCEDVLGLATGVVGFFTGHPIGGGLMAYKNFCDITDW
jgi:hypothetical protein